MESNNNIMYNQIKNSATPVFLLNNGLIEFSNKAFSKMTGYEQTDSMPAQLFFSEEDIAKIINNDETATESSEIIVKLLTRELDLKIILISSFVMDAEKGQHIIFCKDITGARLKQKEMVKAKQYVDSIFSNLEDGVIVIDNEKQVINVNNGALYYGTSKISEIVDLLTKDIELLAGEWQDSYNVRVDFFNFEDKKIYINGNIRKIIINELFDIYIINFTDITMDVELRKEIQIKNNMLSDQLNKMDKELNFARSVQEKMMPPSFKVVGGLSIATRCRIANSLGGDYFEILEENEQKTLFGIFDVSGHGVASSLVVMMLKALLRTINTNTIKDSSESFYYLQSNFNDKIPGKHFVASVFMIYNKESRQLNFCCGGNYLPVLINHKTKTVEAIGKRGFAIGFIPNPNFESSEIPFHEGDKIIMYTDGIVEAANAQGELFGNDKVMNIIEKYKDNSALFIKNKLYSELTEFTGGAEYLNDDVSIMVASVNQTPVLQEKVPIKEATVKIVEQLQKFNFQNIPQEKIMKTIAILKQSAEITAEKEYAPQNLLFEIEEEESCFIFRLSGIDITALSEVMQEDDHNLSIYEPEEKLLQVEMLKNGYC